MTNSYFRGKLLKDLRTTEGTNCVKVKVKDNVRKMYKFEERTAAIFEGQILD